MGQININENDLKLLVFKNVVRIAKNHKVYHIMRCFLPLNHRPYRDSIYTQFKFMRKYKTMADKTKGDNPFYFLVNVDQVLEMLSKYPQHRNLMGKGETNEQKDIQMRITQYINNLLHCTLEYGVQNMEKMGEMGKEIFDMTCKELFGDDFIDETEDSIPPQDFNKFMEENQLSLSDISDNPFIKAVLSNRVGGPTRTMFYGGSADDTIDISYYPF